MKNYIIFGLILVCIVLVMSLRIPKGSVKGEVELGGQIVSTVTHTSVHVNSTSTEVNATSTLLQYFEVQNGTVAGGADAWCAFGAAPTSTSGKFIAYSSSSPWSRFVTTDINLLSKQMKCVGSTTLTIVKY